MGQLKISQRSKRNNKLSGATLIELILTIGIMMILMGMILLNSNLYTSYVEKSELKNLVSHINLTRNLAISRKVVSSIKFDFENNKYFVSENPDSEFELKKIKLISSNLELNSFIFTKNGSPTDKGSGTLLIKGDKITYEIAVEPIIGKVNLREVKK